MEDSSESSRNKELQTVAIIGDWFIDEYWLLTRQHSYHSSAPGDIHYVAREANACKRIVGLCGTPAILEMLRSYFAKKKDASRFEFVGFGVWNPADNPIIKCALCSNSAGARLLTPYTLSGLAVPSGGLCPYESKKSRIRACNNASKLYNLAPVENHASGLDVSTNRIIRCFEGHGGAAPHLIHRVDWRLPVNEGSLDYDPLKRLARKKLSAVVVIDHGYGTINPRTIQHLKAICAEQQKKAGKPVSWFVRTKIDNPKWLRELKADRGSFEFDLLFADFKLASHRKGERRWWYGMHLGRAGLEILGDMTQSFFFAGQVCKERHGITARRAVMFLDDNTIFGMERIPESKIQVTDKIVQPDFRCFGVSTRPSPRHELNVSRSAACFAALIRNLLEHQSGPGSDLGAHCHSALLQACEWSNAATKHWEEEERLFYGDYEQVLTDLTKAPSEAETSKGKYSECWEDWRASSRGLGTITKFDSKSGTPKTVLQAWRGEGTLEGYICVGGPKRDAINHLVSEIAGFERNPDPKLPFSCLLTASPGWGKSHLARCLARYFKMEYLEFSIAQMAKHSDLIDCFATISSVQACTRNKTLIFMDEVNAKIAGSSAIDLLLSPVWEGTFVKEGRVFRLDPSVWVFASTESLDGLTMSHGKGSDFISRMNGPAVELDAAANEELTDSIAGVRKLMKADINMKVEKYRQVIYGSEEYQRFRSFHEDALKTDQVYLMISLLKGYWGPIGEVQEEVLQLFHDLLPVNGIRSMSFLASKFVEIEQGRVVASNIPRFDHSAELRRHIVAPEEWLEASTRPRDRSNNPIEIETVIR